MGTLLYDFLTSFNLFFLLLCIIGLYWSINLVIDYYAPTSTGFVNMYFLYYIFFTTTLLIAVGCSNYIEMDSLIDTSNKITNTDLNTGDIELVPLVTPRAIGDQLNSSNTIAPRAIVDQSNTIAPGDMIIPSAPPQETKI
jgi:hypothetical protein